LVFWLLVFASTRALFLIYYLYLLQAENISFPEAIAGFWYGIPLDIATASYLMVFTLLLSLVYMVFRSNVFLIIDRIYMAIALIAFFLITTGELGVYDEWRTKLNYKALQYLKNPAEIYQSISTWSFFVLVFLLIIQIIVWYYIYRRFFGLSRTTSRFKILPFLTFLILGPGILFIGIRGGIDQIPINQSISFYSRHNILNQAAVNSGNSFMLSMLENFRFREANPFLFMDQEEAWQITRSLHEIQLDTTVSVLKTNRPNIVLILLEGWSADAIESLGGDAGITPHFRNLEKGGILFSNLYASANRSDQGNVSVISGFPATPIASISHVPEKSQKLPSLVRSLKQQGYVSSYYFGGQLIYGGIKSFVMSAGFDDVYEMSNFKEKYPRGKLGIHDEFMYLELIEGLSVMPEPFFSMIFTVSSHPPYDYPNKKLQKFAELENDYLNGVNYSDECLGKFFKKALAQPWYENTLFIIISDHSHGSQKNRHIFSKEYRKIPLLLFGEVIKDEYKGTQISRISSQTDVAATLLYQLEISSEEFFWSRNLFNPFSREFAYYEAGEAVGWTCPDGYFVYRRELDDYFDMAITPEKQEQVIKEGKAYLQTLFQQYLDY
jgi:phosphoglycerol transferase MdoB-like AlkP superfamily enzyme